jgi:hypothetical protein
MPGNVSESVPTAEVQKISVTPVLERKWRIFGDFGWFGE